MQQVFTTKITEMLGIDHPILCGGMQWISRAEFVAAICNAGGLGFITAESFESAEDFREELRKMRDLTDKPFGVNISMLPEFKVPERTTAFCDVVCEEAVFTVGESRRSLLAGLAAGLRPKLHADELHPTGGAELAAEIGAISADHLIRVSDEGIAALAAAGVVAVLLPGTSYFLGMKAFAPGRKMIAAGVPTALATDCNPGSSMTENMQFVMTTACLGYGFTAAEAITAATRNAAFAVGLGDEVGGLGSGKRADLLILDVTRYRQLTYHHGVNHVQTVVHHGEVVA